MRASCASADWGGGNFGLLFTTCAQESSSLSEHTTTYCREEDDRGNAGCEIDDNAGTDAHNRQNVRFFSAAKVRIISEVKRFSKSFLYILPQKDYFTCKKLNRGMQFCVFLQLDATFGGL